MSAIFRVVDGQHRTFAIREIMQGKDAARFKSELISVDLIANASLQLRQKIFREVNTLAKSVSRNLTTVYGDSAIAVFANSVLAAIPLFSDQFTEKEKSSLNAKSEKLFVYKHLYDATIKMKPALGDEADFKFCQTFWEALTDAIAPWHELLDDDRTPSSVREHTVAAHGVTIHALGELGKYLGEGAKLSGNHNSHAKLLKKLGTIDWHKTNSDWLHRVVDANGGMLSKRHNVKLMLNFFKVTIGVPEKNFSKADKELEFTHIGDLKLFNQGI